MKDVLVINGPNLDLLGKREKDIYGENTIEKINKDLKEYLIGKDADIEFYQSNHEGDIVDKINQTPAKGIIINPAAYTHTSVAIHDALRAKDAIVIEVHLSNIYSREEFRQRSMVAPVVKGQITGFGALGYKLALEALLELLNGEK